MVKSLDREPSPQLTRDGIVFLMHYERFYVRREAEEVAEQIRKEHGAKVRMVKKGKWYYLYRTKKGGASW